MLSGFIILHTSGFKKQLSNFCKVPTDSDKVAHTRISLLVLGLNLVFLGTPGMMYSRAN